MTELLPLNGYQSSVAIDANEDGQVVGFSVHSALPGPVMMRATLWETAGEPISLSSSPSNSAAFRINNKSEVLVGEGVPTEHMQLLHGGFHWTPATAYHLWREGQPLVDLADAGTEAVDLNDLSQVLLRKPDGRAAVRNLGTGSTKDLPQLHPDFSDHTSRQYLGIDHAGRVACWFTNLSGLAVDAMLSQAWRLEPDGTDWVQEVPTGPYLAWWKVRENLSYTPRLTQRGLLLANASEYWDLNSKPTEYKKIPVKPKRVGVYRNASPNGQRIFGFEANDEYQPYQHPFLWSNPVATYYDPGAATAMSLGWSLRGTDASIAVAGTDGGLIVGNSAIGPLVRAWKLSLPMVPRRRTVTEREVHPMAVLAHELFLTLTLPDPPPWETVRARAHQQIQAMTAHERRDALARLDQLAETIRRLVEESRNA